MMERAPRSPTVHDDFLYVKIFRTWRSDDDTDAISGLGAENVIPFKRVDVPRNERR